MVGEVVADLRTGARFAVTELIGRGGMGDVFRGAREGDCLAVAIKTVRLDRSDDPVTELRFQYEGEFTSRLRHPNLVPVLAFGVRPDGVAFIVMEFVEGFTVQQIIELRDRIPPTSRVVFALVIALAVCKALTVVHPYAVHRDIKPSNIIVRRDGTVFLIDLGTAKWTEVVARLTSTGISVGTFTFMSPEQLCTPDHVDHRSDFWSLGVVVYMLITASIPSTRTAPTRRWCSAGASSTSRTCRSTRRSARSKQGRRCAAMSRASRTRCS